MKIRENITIYECSFCHKRLLKESAMELHEEWCNSNPKNKKACMGCAHVYTEEVTYYFDHFDGEHSAKSIGFRCTKFNKLMYPFKAEKSALLNFPESFEGQEPMPTTCSAHEFSQNLLTPTKSEWETKHLSDVQPICLTETQLPL